MLHEAFDPSHYFFSPYAVPTAVTAVATFLLGAVVLVRERSSLVSVWFFLMTLAVSAWLFAYSGAYCALDEHTAFRWLRAGQIGILLIPSCIYVFTVTMLRAMSRRTLLVWLSWALSGGFIAAAVGTDVLISGVRRYWWGFYPRYGWANLLFLLFFFAMLGMSLGEYGLVYRRASPGSSHQRRAKWFLIAFGIGYLASLDYLAAYDIPLYPFGYLPVFGFLVVAAYTTWRYRLMDITPATSANQILKTMTGALIVVDQDGIVRVANRSASELFGYSERALIGRPVSMVLDGALSPAALEALLRSGGAIQNVETAFYPKAGGVRALSFSASVMMDRTHHPAGIVCIAQDITERKRAEEVLRKYADEVYDLYNHAPCGYHSLDRNGLVVTMNDTELAWLGYRREDVVGKKQFAELLAPDSVKLFETEFPRFKERGEIRNLEFELVRKDGSTLPVLLSALAIKDAGGQYVASRSTVFDLTERKMLEAQLIQAQKFELIGQLSAGIAHEINTPIQYVGNNVGFLRNIFGNVDRLLDAYARLLEAAKQGTVSPGLMAEIETLAQELELDYLRQEVPKAVEQSLEGIERVAKIVRAVRELSHPGSGKKTPLDLNQTVEHVITMAHSEWRYVAELVRQFDPTLPPVPGLPDVLEQALLNVLINAAQAVADVVGEGTGKKGILTVTTRRVGDWAEIRIRDTGRGIPKAAREHIFTPFFTTKEVGKGTGQGLAIAHSVICRQHGGTLTFETQEGTGTTFVIRLPLQEATESVDEKGHMTPQLTEPERS